MNIEALTTLSITGTSREVHDAGFRALTQGRDVTWTSYDPPTIRVELAQGDLAAVRSVIDIIVGRTSA